jgi:hypothetical protein
VYEIYQDGYGGNWHSTDLTKVSRAGTLAGTYSYNNPAGTFWWAGPDTENVVYIGNDNDIHQITKPGQASDDQWVDNDVSAIVFGSGGAARAVDNPVGVVPESQQPPHSFYHGFYDNHIHEIYNSNSTWQQNDLMMSAGVLSLNATSGPDAYMWVQQGTEHVTFRSAPLGDIDELYNDGSWHFRTIKPSGSQGQPTGPSGYVYQYENTEHVVFGIPNGLMEMYSSGSAWVPNDLSSFLNGKAANGYLTGFAWQQPGSTSGSNFEAIVFVGVNDHHIYELYNMR